MKKLSLAITAAFGFAVASAQAATTVNVSNAATLAAKILSTRVSSVRANQINWQVGQYHLVSLTSDQMGELGDGRMEVTQDVPEQNALWYVSTMAVMGQNQKTEELLSRVDGKVLKSIVNGKEQDPSASAQKIDVLEESETNVTVPAGTFDCLYIKAKVTQQGQDPQTVELYVNNKDVNLDGMLKMVMQSQMGPITLVLKEFGPK